jgi:hypothetical protein
MKHFIIFLILTVSLHASEVLGRIDKFDLPELHLKNITAKIDTGAKTSSLHCIIIKKAKDGFVKFKVLDENNQKFTGNFIIKKVSRISAVKSSNGTSENRYFIKTPITIYDKIYMMETSLSFRGSMKFPLLIGRELLKQNFIVDVTQKNLSFKSKAISQ